MNKKKREPLQKELLQDQQNEIDAYYIYQSLAKRTKNKHNASILFSIASDEKNHYNILKEYTQKEITPNKLKIFFFIFLARFLGFTFAVNCVPAPPVTTRILVIDWWHASAGTLNVVCFHPIFWLLGCKIFEV